MNKKENLEVIFELLDDFTSGGKLYYDDETESIWMINPETKQWIFEFKKSGNLWYFYPTFVDIFKWISMEYPDFVPYIAKWAERILQKEVKNTVLFMPPYHQIVERILQKEVKDTLQAFGMRNWTVERILQKGTELNPDENINESIVDSEEDKLEMIFELLDDFTSGGKLYYDDETDSIWMINPKTKEWIFEFIKSGNLYYSYPIFKNIFKYISMERPDFVPYITKWVERILQKEVKNTPMWVNPHSSTVERILQKGTELNPDENINESVDTNNEEDLEMIFELLDDFTSGGKLYYDDETDSIWMINPKTKQWIFEFEKSGDLYYSYPTFINIFKWISMEYPDFNPYITKWVEGILQKEVKNTMTGWPVSGFRVERILQKGTELNSDENINESVDMNNEEDLEMIFELLDDFTSNAKLYYDEDGSIWMINPETKQWIFEFKKSGNLWYFYPIFVNIFKWISMEHPDFVPYITKWVERILQKEVKNTALARLASDIGVERILQKGTELNPNENINESVVDSEDDKLEVIFELLDDFTSGGKLYYDNEYDSIWMINPKTKQWIFEFKKSGDLWYFYPVFTNIFKWISMEYPDFEPYITKWVERILQNEVKNTLPFEVVKEYTVDRILQSGNELNPDENINESKEMKKTDSIEPILKSFEIKDQLPSDIWYHPEDKDLKDVDSGELKLKPEIRKRLLKIAELFIDSLDVEVFVNDIVITGSLLNFNWSDYSDVDLHVITSFDNYGDDKELYQDLFRLKKDTFNLKHDITIKGYDVELYLEDSTEERFAAGVYSVMNDKWVKTSKKEKATIDLNKVREKSKQWMELIDKLINEATGEDIETVKKLFEKYKEKLRNYRTAGLKKGGEYSYENLVFKVLRRTGYLQKFREADNKIIDKQLTMKENEIFS